jgi:predicted transcriptional regulator
LEGTGKMKIELINLLLFSDKRKKFLLLLAEGPKSIDEVLNLLQIPRVSLLPQIKKLKEEGLIVQEGDIYRLSAIGNILIKKAQPLLNAISVFEENEYFWSQRKLDTIPVSFLRRIGVLKSCQLIGPGIDNWSDFSPESVRYFDESSKVMLLYSYFHPSLPSLCLELANMGIELRLILSKDFFERFCEDFSSEGEKILAQENAKIFVRAEKTDETPAGIAIMESKLLLGLINKKGKFEGQYIMSSESSALSWGKELFEYYIEGSRKISSFDLPEDN